MKLVSLVCPQCGGTLKAPENIKQMQCPFCNTTVMLDDEVQHVQFDNSKQAGYDFEKGAYSGTTGSRRATSTV